MGSAVGPLAGRALRIFALNHLPDVKRHHLSHGFPMVEVSPATRFVGPVRSESVGFLVMTLALLFLELALYHSLGKLPEP